MVNKFSVWQENIPDQLHIFAKWVHIFRKTLEQVNESMKTLNQRCAQEVDILIEQVNCRVGETKELNNMMKNLQEQFSSMEACIFILEEESLEKVTMIQLLTMEVDSLKERCHWG